MHCPTTWGRWVVELVQRSALLPGGGRPCTFCNVLPHRLGDVGSENLATRGLANWGDGESCSGGGHFLKSGTPAMHCHTPHRQLAVQLMLCTAPLPRSSG